MRWAATEGVENKADGDRLKGENSVPLWGIGGSDFFESILSTVRVLQAETTVHPCTTERPWNLHLFSISTFSREFEMRRKKMHS